MKSDKSIRIFKGGVAIVTGGASGIGQAISEELAKRGCEVVIADLQIERAEEIASKIQSLSGSATAVKADVTDFSAMEQIVRETVKRTGRLDYMFNNAGIGIIGHVSHYKIDDWNYIIDINLRGVINGIQAVYNIMAAQGFGHIVNTASVAGLMPCPGMVSYGTTKHAVVGLSKSLRAEAASMGIRVSVFCPGVIRTPILDGGKYGRDLISISDKQKQYISEMFEKLRPMPPHIFAKKALDQVARNKPIIIVPSWWKLFWWIHRLFPCLGISLAQKSFLDGQKQFNG